MRQQRETTETFLKLPLSIQVKESVLDEVSFFADKYKKAKTSRERDYILRGLLHNGGTWDAITRSLIYYEEFERQVGEKLPGLWK
jgi:hypothetical protein